ncbi:hypothetical protein E2L08_06195 [Palleronia sediminis]|uniref:VIT family protein n=1 Tax=Palleronia sediminis TaxID=2547833 RepID=A0A4R6ABR4_9RHOB|nr:VIT1/CCC1 transporter family protein [Palleronia sediminis]TDL81260.1 hypothetical protein E2L08_06195 [Palleronia sediminis]
MPPDHDKPGAPAPKASHLRDAVYGGIDGAVTTFAIVAGVAGAGLPTGIILALGLANVAADGFSMAAGNYSGTKADRDDRHRLRADLHTRIQREPAAMRDALREVFRAKGMSGAGLGAAVDAISADREMWVAMMLAEEHGLGSTEPRPLVAASVTFAAFLGAGIVPLIPFVLSLPAPLPVSAGLTMATFAAIGAIKSRWSLTAWWKSAAETLLIGGTAAIIAYSVGTLFDF